MTIPRPESLLELRVPVEVSLAPDGSCVVYCLKEVAPGGERYRHSLWLVPADGSRPPRRITGGTGHDTFPRFSPDGHALAFLSDRGGDTQVWLLPLDCGEAVVLTDLPGGTRELAWSPAGDRLVVSAAALDREEPAPAQPPGGLPPPDHHLVDRLLHLQDDVGYVADRPGNLWLVDVRDGACRRLTGGRGDDRSAVFAPNGRRIAFVSPGGADADLSWRTDVSVLDLDDGTRIDVTGGTGGYGFYDPAWSPDGGTLAVKGVPLSRVGNRRDVWVFPVAEHATGRNLSGASDLFVDALAVDDLAPAASAPLHWSADGHSVAFTAPFEGAIELWRVPLDGGAVQRVTRGEHCLALVDQVPFGDGDRIAARRAAGTPLHDICIADVPRHAAEDVLLRAVATPMAEAWSDMVFTRPVERWHESDGRRIQGWLLPGAGPPGPKPLVVECGIIYTWAVKWEWQCLAAQGIGVYFCNPRGTQGYGADFYAANFRDWGHGPMADIMAGVDALVGEGHARPGRLGVTGGSHGGYLTAWLIARSERFAAALAHRPVTDWISEFSTGDIAGVHHPRGEYGAAVWEDPDLFWRESPVAHAERIHTPLLLAHGEDDLRCRIGQSEELFTALRSLGRPVRLLRVPGESHELTRSGTPFRRVHGLREAIDWFRHFLVDGATSLPILSTPRVRERSLAELRSQVAALAALDLSNHDPILRPDHVS